MPRDRLTKLKNGWRRPLDYDLCAEIQHHSLLFAVRNEDNAFFWTTIQPRARICKRLKEPRNRFQPGGPVQ